jgi:hypothetical protein
MTASGKAILRLAMALSCLCASPSMAGDMDREFSNPALPKPGLRLNLTGAPETVFSADDPHCPDKDEWGNRIDIPDAPVRAFRGKDGRLRVLAAHYDNLIFATKGLNRLQRQGCQTVFVSRKDGDPSHFADRQWLISVYAMKSGEVFGLVHDEYWGGTHDPYCATRLAGKAAWAGVCVYINLTGATSADGNAFKPLPGVVAALPSRFNGFMDRAGVRDPTNLMLNPKDGYVYFMATVDGYDGQARGTCLFRNRAPFTESWKTWGGDGFTQSMGSPYASGRRVRCEPVGGLETTTLLYHARSGQFIALGQEERLRPGGIFYRTSKDLTHWSRPVMLREAHGFGFWKPGQGDMSLYPSLIDDTSPSLNFDTLGDQAYLYYIRVRTSGSQVADRQRDIMRIKVDIR